MRLELDEVRRLTGPNLMWDKSGAVVDVWIENTDKLAVVNCWRQWMDTLLDAFGWQQTHTYRIHALGANLALSAPMDSLYTACDLAELAWDCCVAQLTKGQSPDWPARLTELNKDWSEEINPPLLSLLDEANKHQVTAISDDDEFSLGMGKNVRVWPIDALPDASQLDWTKYTDIPRAFITGTNGKSTSVRLASEIAAAAGLQAGVTSTDFIRVGKDIIDRGDYSGPGGARMLLRDKRTEIAFLEVARGGILRRGLPIENVDAALITNVASDHLGQYGINTVEELAEAKFVVAKGLKPDGILVLNADNSYVEEQAKNLSQTICWFSTDSRNPLIAAHLVKGGRAVYVHDETIFYCHGGLQQPLIALADIPMTLNGAANHNVQNALGVVGLCKALKLPDEAIKQGLMSFGSNADDNPGRGNIYSIKDFQVIVDFAHNEHSMRAVVNTVNHLNMPRCIVMFSNAGDRTDEQIKQLTAAVRELNADCYIVAELEKYLRGRQLGELPALVTQQLMSQGVEQQDIKICSSPLQGAKYALSQAKAGDMILLFVLDEREEVHELLSSLG